LTNSVSKHGLSADQKEKLFTAIYVGVFLIALAYIYYIHPTILSDIINFFMKMTLSEIPGTGISLPAPVQPAAHLNLYVAAYQFTLIIGMLEILILALRVGLRSSVSRKAETVENIIFWLGTSFLITTYLVNMTISSEWFVFWAGVILIFGLALVARAFVILANRR
jgi:hypothetical protein